MVIFYIMVILNLFIPRVFRCGFEEHFGVNLSYTIVHNRAEASKKATRGITLRYQRRYASTLGVSTEISSGGRFSGKTKAIRQEPCN